MSQAHLNVENDDYDLVYQAYLDSPDNVIAEIIDGTLHTQPKPSIRHQKSSGRIYAGLLNHYDDEDDGWTIIIEPELHLGDTPDILAPDVAGWRKNKMPEEPDEVWIGLAPDWVCEVLSPSTARYDRTLKKAAYRKHGVEWYWLVDPIYRTIEVYQSNDIDPIWYEVGVWGDDYTGSIPPFVDMVFDVSKLWVGTKKT